MACEFGRRRAYVDSFGSQARYVERDILITGICGAKRLHMGVCECSSALEEETTDPPSRANVRVRAEMPRSVRMKIGDKQRSPISTQGPGGHSSPTPHCAGKVTSYYD